MFGVLLKKQFLELYQGFFFDRRKNKKKSPAAILLVIFLLGMVGVSFFTMFFEVASNICVFLNKNTYYGIGQEYLFAVMGIGTLLFGTIGSVFSTYQAIYGGKDNEMLLSMPIPTQYIIVSRIMVSYISGIFGCGLIWVPTCFAYWSNGHTNVLEIVFPVILLFFISALSLIISCILAWIVALLISKSKKKNIFTIVFSIICFGLYYYFINSLSNVISFVIDNIPHIAKNLKTYGLLFYIIGKGSTADLLCFGIVVLFIAALSIFVIYLININFIKIAISSSNTNKTKYIRRQLKTNGQFSALLKRDFQRFINCPTYVLNCGLGVLIMPLVGVILYIKRNNILSYFETGEIPVEIANIFIPILLFLISTSIVSVNNIAAPSISLEGQNLWILQSGPIEPKKIIDSKILMEILINVFPSIIMAIFISFIKEMDIITFIFELIAVILFVVFSAMFGMFVGLNKPLLYWTNETIVVKQSTLVVIALFGGWGISILLTAIAGAISWFIGTSFAFIFIDIILVVFIILFNKWNKKSGSKILMFL